jgi:ankyrin repeat protein
LTNPTRNDPKNDIAKTQAELEQEKLKEAYTRAFPNYDLEAIKACVEKGCSVNNPGRCVFDSPLYLAIRAVRRDNFEEVKQIIDYLVEKGADVNQKDSGDCVPIHYAIETNNLQMVQLLISHGADKNIKYQQVPMFSFSAPDPEKNLLDYTQEKLKSNLSIKDKDNQYRKEAEAILQLFKEDASPLSSNDNQEQSKTEVTPKSSQVDVLPLGTDFIQPPVGQKPPLNRLELFNVVRELNYDKIRDYLNSGYSINPEVGGISLLGMTIDALFYSSEKENNDLLERLIKDGADINQKDSDGKAPLHYAISTINLAAIKFLMSKKVDTQILYTSPDTGEQTLLAYATSSFEIDKKTAKLFNYSKDLLDVQSKMHKAILEILRTANPADLSIYSDLNLIFN